MLCNGGKKCSKDGFRLIVGSLNIRMGKNRETKGGIHLNLFWKGVNRRGRISKGGSPIKKLSGKFELLPGSGICADQEKEKPNGLDNLILFRKKRKDKGKKLLIS